MPCSDEGGGCASRWRRSPRECPIAHLGVTEQNVINWAIALTRANTDKARKHAAKMLLRSVERLGDGR